MPGESPRAVVVDRAWKVAVLVRDARPALPELPPESAAHFSLAARVLSALGLEVELVAPLGEDLVCRSIGGSGSPEIEWWWPSRAMAELPDERERRLVRRAVGPC